MVSLWHLAAARKGAQAAGERLSSTPAIVDAWNHALEDEFGLQFHHEVHCEPYGFWTTKLESI